MAAIWPQARVPAKRSTRLTTVPVGIDRPHRARCHLAMVSLALPARWLRRSAVGVLDLLLPPRCLSCGTTVGGNGELCPSCWRSITFLGAPHCACCGLPFAFDAG